MNRRGFLSLPVVAGLARLCAGIKRRVARQFVTVGKGCDHETIASAWAEVSEAGGGTIYVTPGIHEVHGFQGIGRPMVTITGLGSGEERPVLKGRA